MNVENLQIKSAALLDEMEKGLVSTLAHSAWLISLADTPLKAEVLAKIRQR